MDRRGSIKGWLIKHTTWCAVDTRPLQSGRSQSLRSLWQWTSLLRQWNERTRKVKMKHVSAHPTFTFALHRAGQSFRTRILSRAKTARQLYTWKLWLLVNWDIPFQTTTSLSGYTLQMGVKKNSSTERFIKKGARGFPYKLERIFFFLKLIHRSRCVHKNLQFINVWIIWNHEDYWSH